MNGQIRRIELGDGEVVYARVSAADGYGSTDRDVGTGLGERAAAKLEELNELIRRVGVNVLDAAAAVKPDTATISFGVELTVKAGKAVAVLAEGEATASLQVTLGWQFADGRERGADGAGPPNANG
ncbi:CU044_2847 family protein [Streptomyces sp. SP18CS02]|uniref:CU044_2847 family protein n=1 Tax=Streptomyces sp. SP18CS02 TaxID=3002531 RepID=UPI002E75D65D|nr:CU044_2847 family protein [Streptomyces sp. SP18CS02]MEE1757257.1 CU044_2847 family protein [Streptomyces sp. SP18CS02]